MELPNPPLVVSADSPDGLAAAAERLRREVEAAPDEALAGLGHRQLAAAHASLRGAVLAPDRDGLLSGLTALAQGRPARGVLTGSVDVGRKPVLVFPGQAPAWPGMATGLLASWPELRDRLDEYGRALSPHLGWDPGAALVAGEEFSRLAAVQPVQFALVSALADGWRSVGLRASAMVGHSAGEVVAAHACGALGTEDAARVVALCGTAFDRIEGRGAMASVAASAERVGPLLDEWRGRLDIAAVNSARNVTVSGDPDAVDELLARLTHEGVWAWKVPGVAVAGHSPQVDALRDIVVGAAPQPVARPSQAALYSTVTGARIDGSGLTPQHWFRNLRDTVLFEQAVRTLVEDGHRLFVEVSAHPVLTTVIGETLRAAGVSGAVVSTLDRRKSDQESFLYGLAQAFVNGVPVRWEAVYGRLTPEPRATATAPWATAPESRAPEPPAAVSSPGTDVLDHAVLRSATEAEQRELLVELIGRETGRVLGHSFSVGTQTFLEIGLTSLGVVELALGLSAATGLALPATLLFDHPTPVALAEHLRQALGLVPLDGSDPSDGSQIHRVRRSVSAAEPIAIVGTSCRFPGGVVDAEGLWRLVLGGRDAIDDLPGDRGWDTERLYDPAPGEPGRISSRKGGFLYDAAGFDAGFFGLSPREATAMEPQQRLLLEVSWEAVEDAGIDPESLRGSRTGVFAGVIAQEYGPRLHRAPEEVAGHAFLGTALSVASGRVAYTLGLEGPAITLDTACSSSLVAIHQACRALRDDDCELALAGGATVMSGPGVLVEFSRQRVLAPDGRCKAFSAAADGIGLSEGVGMVLLERLSDARAHGHPVLAVIRGSAVNQDGASNGLSAPSGSAQQRVIRHALADAGLDAGDVDVVEAHGTGTRLGDPVEAHALLATYGHRRPAGQPVLLGSVKSNLGHTQAAAGVAGVIKMVMALRHGLLPRSLHIDAPSPHIDWSSGAVRLLTEEREWPDAEGRPRRAAVSSFGVSGTNGHVVLEQAPVPVADDGGDPSGQVLWPVSAKSGAALRAQAARLHRHVLSRPGVGPVEVGRALESGRSGFPHRAVVWGDSRDELLDGLRALGERREHPRLVQGVVPAAGPGKLVLVFPGQGAQWPGMGMELYDSFDAYRRAFDEADEALRHFTGWSVVDVLRGEPDAPGLERIDVVQPALFAVMTALARLWESSGLVADAVLGHSQGEIAAAHIAGALGLEDAARLVALRSRALSALSGTGAMAVLGLSADEVRPLIDRYDGRVGVAAANSPASTVVAGDEDAVAELLEHCHRQGVRAKRIAVDLAGHSPRIAPLRAALLKDFAEIAPRPTNIAFYSTVDGHPHDVPLDGTSLTAAYWYDNLRNSVRFADAVRALAGQSYGTFLECSPHPVLVAPVEEGLDAGGTVTGGLIADGSVTGGLVTGGLVTGGLVTGTLRQGVPQEESFAAARARLRAHGHRLGRRQEPGTGRYAGLPTYPFEHRRYWLAAESAADAAGTGQRATGHPLLGAAVDLPDDEGVLLTGRIGVATHPWLADHGAAGVVLLPGTAYVDMALYAAGLTDRPHIAELTLHAPVVLPDHDAVDLQLRVGSPDQHGERPLTVHARPAADGDPGDWTLHATARLAPEPAHPAEPAPWPPVGAEPVDLGALRKSLAEAGYDYGPAFTGLSAAWRDGEEHYAEARLPDGLAVAGHRVHPALLDTLLHPVALPEEADGLRLPFTFSGITLAKASPTRLRVHLRTTAPGTVRVTASDETGSPVLTIDALTLRTVGGDQLRGLVAAAPEHDLLHLDWSPLPPDQAIQPDIDGWTLLGSDSGPEFAALPRHTGLDSLTAALDAGAAVPRTLVWPLPEGDGGAVPDAARARCREVLRFLQAWLADERLKETVLAVVTRHAVVTGPEDPPGLAQAPAWGLLHTAQSEHPGRIVLVDTDDHPDSLAALTGVLAAGRPQTALRHGRAYLPRLARSHTDALQPPPGTPLWRLDTTGAGGLDRLALVPAPEAAAVLEPGQVRIDVRAAGMNFYDTAGALGLIPPQHDFGAEAAGVVTETGPGVEGVAVGDRVMALTERAFGPVVVADRKALARIPDGWTFSEAGAVPVAFVTAYHALVDLARVRPGETVLIHAAAGGVGQAATQLALHLGAVPFATAHPDKWGTLRALGYPPERIANSRTLDFARRFREATGGRGVDVVLNALAGPFTDASLDLVAPGGRVVELGKTDIRDAGQLAVSHPHLGYQAFDRRVSADRERTARILAELLRLFGDGVLTPLPVTSYGIRHAPRAFRLMRDARHIGKLVLTLPRRLDPDGTVLITGGTGTLGGLLARHLVAAHGVRHLLLASRSGGRAEGADRLRADLEAAGATVVIAHCDTSDPRALRDLLDSVPPGRPLTGVFHTAGVLADGTVTRLTPGDLDATFAPKVDAAWHLHELTRDLDLAAFVLYSSSAGTLGNPGQGNYAAANSFLDALAHHRRRQGLAGTSVAWGWWQPVTGLSRGLTDTDNSRIARTGLAPITAEHGHALLDAALELPHPVVTAAPLHQRTLRDNSRQDTLHPLLERLTASPVGRREQSVPGSGPDLREDLTALAPEARRRRLESFVAGHTAGILGLDSGASFAPDQPFKAIGLDSLTALELRNRLAGATGLQLPATLAYDCPTPAALAAHLGERLFPDPGPGVVSVSVSDGDARLQQAIASIPLARLRELGLLDTLLHIAQDDPPTTDGREIEDIRSASLDELVAMALSSKDAE